ncbi:MAG: outer membrane lipoprotein-sorting protein [Saprospiraceae bacterium]|nr:outer membrane lipoprotein-sorting protein [Saprospiraceae bacterium]
MMSAIRVLLLLLVLIPVCATAQPVLTAVEVIRKMDEKARGDSSVGEMRMTIVRPKWSREIQMKTWSKGDDLSLILVTAPARDKGTAFLKRDREMWNWQPAIDRTIKLPPSMMMQSWMGSDFTNDDLVKESSVVEDYHHEFLTEGVIAERPCFQIELTPKPGVAVVWGKVITWVDKKDFLQLRSEFYDEDGYLLHTFIASDIKMLGGRLLPARLEIFPEDKEGHKTIVEYLSLNFDQAIADDFFSIQNMKSIR